MRKITAWIVGFAIGSAVLIPIGALFAGLILVPSEHGVRISAFPAALVVFDPYLIACVRNSTILAIGVAISTRLIGVTLARISTRRTFWGRRPLTSLAFAPLLTTPLCLAIGIEPAVDFIEMQLHHGFLFLARHGIDRSGSIAARVDELARGIAIVAMGTIWGAPIVAARTSRALRRVEAVWEDAARGMGASRSETKRIAETPLVRPEIARSIAFIFTLVLVDPIGPLIFGFRRTIAYRIVRAIDGLWDVPGSASTAAGLAIAAIVISASFRAIAVLYGGKSATIGGQARRPARKRAGTLEASAIVACLSIWIAIAWAPLVALGSIALEVRSAEAGSTVIDRLFERMNELASAIEAEDFRAVAFATAIAAIGAAFIGRIVAAARIRSRSNNDGFEHESLFLSLIESIPPLCLGAGIVSTGVLAASLGFASPRFRPIARFLDPALTPGPALIWALALIGLPWWSRIRMARDHGGTSEEDAARLIGATRGEARRLAKKEGKSIGAGIGAMIAAAAIAAVNVSPALLLTPARIGETIGPATVDAISGPRPDRAAAATLALASIVLVAIARFAARKRNVPPLDEAIRS